MNLAIMQPYIFPYIGYFQLINAVDAFVFYDDVNYIKRGWINRNQLLINNQAKLFTIPVLKASQNKLIQEIELGIDEKWLSHFYTTLEQNYKKAPHYKETIVLIKKVFNKPHQYISDIAIESITQVSNYIGLKTVFKRSSTSFQSSKGLEKADRLIDITKKCNSIDYVNPCGGIELYDKKYFKQQGINLYFIENSIAPYAQFKNDFVGGLSIIDVLMFNSKEEIKKLLTEFTLI